MRAFKFLTLLALSLPAYAVAAPKSPKNICQVLFSDLLRLDLANFKEGLRHLVGTHASREYKGPVAMPKEIRQRSLKADLKLLGAPSSVSADNGSEVYSFLVKWAEQADSNMSHWEAALRALSALAPDIPNAGQLWSRFHAAHLQLEQPFKDVVLQKLLDLLGHKEFADSDLPERPAKMLMSAALNSNDTHRQGDMGPIAGLSYTVRDLTFEKRILESDAAEILITALDNPSVESPTLYWSANAIYELALGHHFQGYPGPNKKEAREIVEHLDAAISRITWDSEVQRKRVLELRNEIVKIWRVKLP